MKYKILITILAVIFAAGVVGSVMVLIAPKNNSVNIISDGKVVRTVDLTTAQNETFSVEYGGSTNTVEIKDGKIRVQSAECPDKTCVHMGWLKSSAMPIVCLPNHLVIEFVNTDGGVDAITE